MITSEPRRLTEDPRYGRALRNAREDEPSSEMLERVERRVLRVTAGGAAPAARWPRLALGIFIVSAAGGAAAFGLVLESKAPSPTKPKHRGHIAVVAPSPPTIVTPAESPPPAPRRAPMARVAPPPPAEPASNGISEQVEALRRAEATAAAGKYSDALATLDGLSRRYPDSSLKPEITLARVDALRHLGRYVEARSALVRILDAKVLPQREGELWVVLGDLDEKAGDCAGARTAYTHAVGLRLTSAQALAAEGGLSRCKAP